MSPAPLSSTQRARLYRGLERLDEAGLPLDRAVAALSGILGPRHAHRFHRASAEIAAGLPLSRAAGRAGLLGMRERALLALAEQCGNLGRAAGRLADASEFRARIYSRLKSRMALPLFVLALGLLLAPLPELVSGETGAAGYMLKAAAPLLALVLLIRGLPLLARRLAAGGIRRRAARSWLALPLLSPGLSAARRLELMEDLALLLDAGIPAQQALDAVFEASSVAAAENTRSRAKSTLENGNLSRALRTSGMLDAEAFALLSASEDAGRLVDGLNRVAERFRDEVESRLELTAEWLPRLVYLAIIGFIAASLLA